MPLAFVPGYAPPSQSLLSRFLAPLEEGIAADFIERHTRAGDLVFDPFGQSPRVALEALTIRRRAVVASFNPITRLALSLAVRPPSEAELRSALTVLADYPVGGQDGGRLEDSIRGLYRTRCADCHAETVADSFEWGAGAEAPEAKTYFCQTCGGPLTRPADEADRALAGRFKPTGLDYYYLLDRVTALNDPDRERVQEVLELYAPRAVAALGATVKKFETLDITPETRRILAGLLLAALDATCALGPERPKALTRPPRYQELNFWLALENAVGLLVGTTTAGLALPLADLLAQPDQTGIYAHPGTVHELVGLLPQGSCALGISAIPRPNPVFWALSAVWSAWLWGRGAAEPLRGVLRRRRYDWEWHAHALARSFSSVPGPIALGGRLAGLISEAEPGLTAGVFLAGDIPGLALEGAALRADTGEAQIVWQRLPATAAPVDGSAGEHGDVSNHDRGPWHDWRQVAAGVAREALLLRGEPSRWEHVHFAVWQKLAERHALAPMTENPLGTANHRLEPVFREPGRYGLDRLNAETAAELATGQWFLSDWDAQSKRQAGTKTLEAPLADRVEAEVLTLLSGTRALEQREVERAVCAAFPGLQTPGRALVLACLSSYGQKDESGLWRLRPEDEPEARSGELQSILAHLRALAVRNEYIVAGDNPHEWHEAAQAVYVFAVMTSAMVSRYLFPAAESANARPSARRRFLVLPGGRASLAAFKLRRDPRLRAALQEGNWMIVKFRTIRRMAGDAGLTRATLEPAFARDLMPDDAGEAGTQLALPRNMGTSPAGIPLGGTED